MGFATALFVFLFVAAAEAKEYLVGGSEGWATGVDYNSWVSSNTFSVGDTLGIESQSVLYPNIFI
jgi:hypothetical protein